MIKAAAVSTVASGEHAVTAVEAMQDLGLVLVSVPLLRLGLGMLRRNVAALRRRRLAPPLALRPARA